MKRENAQTASPAQMMEPASVIIRNLPDMSPTTAQGWIGNPRAVATMLRRELLPPEERGANSNAIMQFEEWRSLYRRLFGITPQQPEFPATKSVFTVLIHVAKGFGVQDVIALCRGRFKVEVSLPDEVKHLKTVDERVARYDYAVWAQGILEADAVHNPKPATYYRSQQIPTMTLLERLLLELQYHEETGGHIDSNCGTLCSGTRISEDWVPTVFWREDAKTLEIGSIPAHHFYSGLPAREVVAC